MSISSSWMESLHKGAIKHFLSKEISLPWETDREIDGEKVSITILTGSAKENSKDQYTCTFKVLMVCTVSSEGLYDLSIVSGEVSSLLLEPVIIDFVCARPSYEKVEVDLFDWKHGYKQSRMEQEYSIDLRG